MQSKTGNSGSTLALVAVAVFAGYAGAVALGLLSLLFNALFDWPFLPRLLFRWSVPGTILLAPIVGLLAVAPVAYAALRPHKWKHDDADAAGAVTASEKPTPTTTPPATTKTWQPQQALTDDDLYSLAQYGKEEELKALLTSDPDVVNRPFEAFGRTTSLLEEALSPGHGETLRIVLKHGAGLEAIWRHVRVPGVSDKVSPTKTGIVHQFVRSYPREIAIELLTLELEGTSSPGGDENLITRYLQSGGEIPRNIYHRRITQLSRSQIDDLVQAGVDINVENHAGQTVLFTAVASSANIALLGDLLERGLDIDHQDNDGATPLWHAVEGRCDDMVAELLRRGANPELRAYPNGGTGVPEAHLNSRPVDIATGKSRLLLTGKDRCDECVPIRGIDYIVDCGCGEGMPLDFSTIDRANGSLLQHDGCKSSPVFLPPTVICPVCDNVKKNWRERVAAESGE